MIKVRFICKIKWFVELYLLSQLINYEFIRDILIFARELLTTIRGTYPVLTLIIYKSLNNNSSLVYIMLDLISVSSYY